VVNRFIDALRCPYGSESIVVAAKKFDREVPEERMDAMHPCLAAAGLHITVWQILRKKDRGRAIGTRDRLGNLIGSAGSLCPQKS
jgi:hypothetical protein